MVAACSFRFVLVFLILAQDDGCEWPRFIRPAKRTLKCEFSNRHLGTALVESVASGILNLGIRPVYETLVREAIPGLRKKKWVVYWRLKILIIVLVQRSYGKVQRVEALVQGSLISSEAQSFHEG